MSLVKCLFPAVCQHCRCPFCSRKAAVGTPSYQRHPQVPGSASPGTREPCFCSEGQCCHPSVSPGCSWDLLLELCHLALRFEGSPAAREACVQGPAEPRLALPEGWARGSIPANCPTSCAALSINLMGSLYRQDSWGLIVFPFFN